MIVKNEAEVIERCLSSLRSLIHFWVIVDTGSTDGTQAILQKALQEIPGELYERPWVDFSHNRNEALALAKGKADYILFMDADDHLEFSETFLMPDLHWDYYLVVQEKQALLSMTTQTLLLINSRLDWKWEGVIHELIGPREGRSYGILPGIRSIYHQDGNRSKDPHKFLNDAKLLEKAHQKEPLNSRNVLYLALSYEVAGENEKALPYYEKRSQMGGWEEEVFYSLFRIAHIQRRLKMDPGLFIQGYLRAYERRPTRAEPLYWLADYYLSVDNYLLGYVVSKLGASIPLPEKDLFYVERFVYEHGLQNQRADCAYYLGRRQETLEGYRKILSLKQLPLEVRKRIENNLRCLL